MANDVILDCYTADLQPFTSGDEIDPTIGLKLKLYGPANPDGTLGNQMATVHLGIDHTTGELTLTVYRDEDVNLAIRTVDYFDGSRDGISSSHPNYYTVLRP